MNKEVKSPTISEDEIVQYEAKCKELATKHGVSQVHCCIQLRTDDGSNDRIVSYIKEPNYVTKLALMDKAAVVGPMNAAEDFRNMCLIREESDRLADSDDERYDQYKLGVAQFCVEIITIAQSVYKKK